MILPNGQRAGFFIGDGAGVGKGRQVNGGFVVTSWTPQITVTVG